MFEKYSKYRSMLEKWQSPNVVENKSKSGLHPKKDQSAPFSCSVPKLLQVRALGVPSDTFLSPEACLKKTKSFFHRKIVKVQTREGVKARIECETRRDRGENRFR